MKYAVADTTNGILETFNSLEEAEASYKEYIRWGIIEEQMIQPATWLTDDEIEAKVTSFYLITRIQ